MTIQPTERFSSRVTNYARYRPSYPAAVIELLRRTCGLAADSLVADVAFGTGIFTRLLLETGCRVTGVEPNAAMRSAGEEFLADYPKFTSIEGTAEAMTLADRSVDIVTAAQAAHWFNPEKARREFRRILRPGGWLALLWNVRSLDATPFARDYEQLLIDYGTDYEFVRHEGKAREVPEFFPGEFQTHSYQWRQEFDYPALQGRLLSSSYSPEPSDSRYEPMLRELRRIFDVHKEHDRVAFDYDTLVHIGQFS
jgi:SAM-dependent methyltransferase